MIFVRLIDLPSTVKGTVVKDENDDYNIYLNCNLSCDAQFEAYKHEMGHIERDHFSNGMTVKEKEYDVSQSG